MKRSRHISLEVAEDEPLAKRQKTAHILELAAQNKITSKNSWQLDLLERFEQVIEELTENDKFEHAAYVEKNFFLLTICSGPRGFF